MTFLLKTTLKRLFNYIKKTVCGLIFFQLTNQLMNSSLQPLSALNTCFSMQTFKALTGAKTVTGPQYLRLQSFRASLEQLSVLLLQRQPQSVVLLMGSADSPQQMEVCTRGAPPVCLCLTRVTSSPSVSADAWNRTPNAA